MTAKLTLDEVLLEAIQREVELYLLYLDLSHRVADKTIKEACQELARQEHGHQERLASYWRSEFKKGTTGKDHLIDYRITQYREQAEISPEMKVEEVFPLVADREKAAHELYHSLAGMYPVMEVRKLFEELASQELEHKQRVEQFI